MIWAEDITNYDLDETRLQEQLLFWCVVAGKTANQMSHKLEQFLARLERRFGHPSLAFHADQTHYQYSIAPFALVRHAITTRTLEQHLRAVGMGKYTLLKRCFREVITLSPRWCTLEELEAVPGIGPKTARCFLLHTRPNQRLAGLDTHVLKALKIWGHDVPKSTPTGKRYRDLEVIFLQEADRRGMTPASLDLRIWKHFAKREDASYLFVS